MKKPKKPLDNQQDAVIADYTVKGRNREALHMFFSPWRVPVGLTDEEVQICISLYLLKKTQMQRREKLLMEKIKNLSLEAQFAYMAKSVSYLPEEFKPTKVMTRGKFRRGVWKFIQQVHT